jgi:hypothetical protein
MFANQRNQSNSGQASPMFNLASAAAATGVDRCTILCAIKGGRLNAQRDAKGSWEIQPCELFRVFPAIPASTTQPDQQRANDPAPLLRNAAQELVDEMQRRERDQRDRWRDALLAMQRHLSDAEKTTEKRNAAPGVTMEEAPAQHGAEVDKRRRSWWPWGRRRGHAERKTSENDRGGQILPAG